MVNPICPSGVLSPLLLDMEERVGAFDSEAVATSSTADIRCVGLRAQPSPSACWQGGGCVVLLMLFIPHPGEPFFLGAMNVMALSPLLYPGHPPTALFWPLCVGSIKWQRSLCVLRAHHGHAHKPWFFFPPTCIFQTFIFFDCETSRPAIYTLKLLSPPQGSVVNTDHFSEAPRRSGYLHNVPRSSDTLWTSHLVYHPHMAYFLYAVPCKMAAIDWGTHRGRPIPSLLCTSGNRICNKCSIMKYHNHCWFNILFFNFSFTDLLFEFKPFCWHQYFLPSNFFIFGHGRIQKFINQEDSTVRRDNIKSAYQPLFVSEFACKPNPHMK